MKIDDELKLRPGLARERPVAGIAPTLSNTELLTLAVMGALLGYTSDRRWLRRAHAIPAHVPVSARPVWIRQKAPQGSRPAQARDQDAGRGHLAVER